MILQLLVDKASFNFDPPLDVLSISLLDTKQNKEALVGKYTKSKNPSDDNASFNFDPPPLPYCRRPIDNASFNLLKIFNSNFRLILQLTTVMILQLLVDSAQNWQYDSLPILFV